MYRILRFAKHLRASRSLPRVDGRQTSFFSSVSFSVGAITSLAVVIGDLDSHLSCDEETKIVHRGNHNLEYTSAAVEAEFQQYLESAQGDFGPHVKRLSTSLAHRGQPLLEILTAGSKNESACGLAALLLLHFADFSLPVLSDDSTGDGSPKANAVRSLAIDLHGRFVEAARACGGVPKDWSSACRNTVASAYAFPLMADSDVRAITAELISRGVSMVIDPLAGTGLHARMLYNAGLRVIAQDARPMSSVSDGLAWHNVQKCFLEDAIWSDWDSIDTAMWLSWPPRLSSASEIALREFRGRYVVLIGDRGHWTGSDAFHSMLADSWTEVWRLQILQWPHMQDDVRLFERRVA